MADKQVAVEWVRQTTAASLLLERQLVGQRSRAVTAAKRKKVRCEEEHAEALEVRRAWEEQRQRERQARSPWRKAIDAVSGRSPQLPGPRVPVLDEVDERLLSARFGFVSTDLEIDRDALGVSAAQGRTLQMSSLEPPLVRRNWPLPSGFVRISRELEEVLAGAASEEGLPRYLRFEGRSNGAEQWRFELASTAFVSQQDAHFWLARRKAFHALAPQVQRARSGFWAEVPWIISVPKEDVVGLVATLIDRHPDVPEIWVHEAGEPPRRLESHQRKVAPDTGTERPAQPRAQLILDAKDAEVVAAQWVRWLGFEDAQRTPDGADGGVDVRGSGVVAQVKLEAVPTGRPPVQSLYGIAQHERAMALFFSAAGYTRQAHEWADEAGVYLFTFDRQGRPVADNERARVLFGKA